MKILQKIKGKYIQIKTKYLQSNLNWRYKRELGLRKSGSHEIFIDGGLGSQIMQFALYSWMKEKKLEVNLNANYFYSSHQDLKSKSTQWSWELDYYGHAKPKFSTSSRLTISPIDFSYFYSSYYSEIFHDRAFLNKTFKIQDEYKLKNEFSMISPIMSLDTTIIHVRQGDYINTASVLLSDDYYLKAIDILQSEFPTRIEKIIFVSDEAISTSRHPGICRYIDDSKGLKNIKVLSGRKANLQIHNLMRNAAAVVCSNSAFSFSAAMLNPTGTPVFPSYFYSGLTAAYNPIFKLDNGISIDI